MSLRSVGTRLTFWYTGILCLTLILLGSIAYGLLRYSLFSDIDVALRGVAQNVAERIQKEGAASFPPDLGAIFERFFGYAPANPFIDMRDNLGRQKIYHQHSLPQLPLNVRAMHNAVHGIATYYTLRGYGPYPIRVLSHPIIERGRLTTVVQVGMSLEHVQKRLRRFVLVMAAIFPLGLLLAGGGGWLLARRALRPVDYITKAAQRISGEHLNERLHETGSGDELDRLTRTFNEMLSRLDGSFRQVRQFSADASHELQTPLTILKGEIEVALLFANTPEDYRRVLHSSLEEIERISRLVDGLLLLARADSGVLRIEHKPVALHELVTEVAIQMQKIAEDQDISLHLKVLEKATISGDKDQLLRLLFNLVDNAIKYTLPRGSITLSLHREGNQALIEVIDVGIGLTEEEQARIFTRFYRAAEARSQYGGGSGLGLCIAQSIAEAHGGEIRVQSNPGRGSTFTLVLPAVCESANPILNDDFG